MRNNWKILLYCIVVSVAIALTALAGNESLVTTGRVMDDQGKPVEGAKIMIIPGRDNVGISDSQGQFKITRSPRSWQNEDVVSYIIATYKAKNLGLALPIDNKSGIHHLRLKPAVSLLGKVVDTEGKSISGVQLSVMFRTSNWSQVIDSQNKTDANGVFKFDALPVENLYRFRAGADGYGQTSINFDTGNAVNGHLDLGRIELALANMSVSGRVVDIHGHPIFGIDVYCPGEGQPRCQTKSDEQGYFTLDGFCSGLVRIFAEGWVSGESISCQILTEAGARDVKIMVREGGYSRSYYVRTKSHEEIIKSGNPFIAGRVVDEDGQAVADVPVNVRCMQSKNEKGQDTESYFTVTKFGDVTDQQGRFAIEMEEKATYSLLFSPINRAAMIVYDVQTGTRDLEVILPNGGTITGRLVRFNQGEKVPIQNALIELQQTSRMSYSHIGTDRDRKAVTDSQGQFRFNHISTLMRTDRQRSVFGPRVWELQYDGTSRTVKFLQGETIKQIELIIPPNLAEAVSLTGKPLPDYTGIDVDLNQDRLKEKRLLICFFDYAQRPARRYVLQLNGRLSQLREQDIEVIAVQASKTEGSELGQWVKKINLSVPIAAIIGDIDETRFIWNVQSLPWLILTDREHVVVSEGFALKELEDTLKTD